VATCYDCLILSFIFFFTNSASTVMDHMQMFVRNIPMYSSVWWISHHIHCVNNRYISIKAYLHLMFNDRAFMVAHVIGDIITGDISEPEVIVSSGRWTLGFIDWKYWYFIATKTYCCTCCGTSCVSIFTCWHFSTRIFKRWCKTF
jgi:hypothetical protein